MTELYTPTKRTEVLLPPENGSESDSSVQVEDEVPSPFPDRQCSRTVPVSAKYRIQRPRKGKPATANNSLSSPISILASPGAGLVSGPHSAPATFSWGKQSPIPHRNSPSLNPPSPFLLSPGQEHFPPTLTSSPLLPPPAAAPPDNHPSRLYPLPLAEGRITPLAMQSEAAQAKPSIPVGIAVGRQRQTEASASTAVLPQLKEASPAVGQQQQIPWSIPILPHTPTLAPIIHPGLPLPEYLTRDPLQGAYLGGGGGPPPYWNPYSSYGAYPFLLPSSLSHYQHYQQQLLLLQQSHQGGLYPGLGAGKPPGGPPPPSYPALDPFRPLPPLSTKKEKEEEEEEEVKILGSNVSNKDDSGLGSSDFSRTESVRLHETTTEAEGSGSNPSTTTTEEDGSVDLSRRKEAAPSPEEDNISVGTESVDQENGGAVSQRSAAGQTPSPSLNQISQNIQSVIDSSSADRRDDKILSGEQMIPNLSDPPTLSGPPSVTGPTDLSGGTSSPTRAETRPELTEAAVTAESEAERRVSSEAERRVSSEAERRMPSEAERRVPSVAERRMSSEAETLAPSEAERLVPNEAERRVPSGFDLLNEGIERLSREKAETDHGSDETNQKGESSFTERSSSNSQPEVSEAAEDEENIEDKALNLAKQLVNFASGQTSPGHSASSSGTRPCTPQPTSQSVTFASRTSSPIASRSNRHASADSHHSHLGLLCDIASKRMEQEGLSPGRVNRSRSVEADSPYKEHERIMRKVSDPVAQQNIRDFIQRRSSRSSDGHSPGRLGGTSPYRAGSSPYKPCSSPYRTGSSPCKQVDLDDMDAWEISMRLDMADIQKKYREKYRELYKLQSKKERRKPKISYKRKSTDSKNLNSPKTKLQFATTKPTLKPASNRTSTEDNLSESSDLAADSESELRNLNNNSESEKSSIEEAETKPFVKSSFDEQFAKFKKSYLSSKFGADKNAQPKLSATAVSASTLKVKIDRPNPFENLMKLPGNNATTIKTEPFLPADIKLEPEEEPEPEFQPMLAAKPEVSKIFKASKRKKHSEDESRRDHSKKRPKLEKYIVLKTEIKGEQYAEDELEPVEAQHREHKKSKDRCRREHKNCKKHKDRLHGKKYKNKEQKSGAGSKYIRLAEYAEPADGHQLVEDMGKADRYPTYSTTKKAHKEHHRKDKKRDKEKKKKKRKEKEKKLKRVKVREICEDDYIMQIMDRTPTPSRQHASTPTPPLHTFIKQEIKEEPPQEDWENIEDKIASCVLTESNLRDGQRILTRIGSHFHPGRITEISPPDIYGILVDRERGNKPHIYSREEVLAQAILEVSPSSVCELKPGVRVCSYWSSKYNYLHPGTIVENTQGLNLPPGYLVIELDDGDSRDFHVDSIRYLPPGYPTVVGDCDPMSGLAAVRRRRVSSVSQDQPKKPRKEEKSTKAGKKSKEWRSEVTPNLKIRIRSPEQQQQKDEGPPVLTPEVCRPLNATEDDVCPELDRGDKVELPGTSSEDAGRIRDEDEDSAFESNGGRQEEDLEDLDQDLEASFRKRMPSSDKSKIRAFLPPQHVLWDWIGKGTKPKNKTRKVFHTEICRGEERIKVGESAVFLSTSRPDRPYIGKIENMWESWSGNMKVRVRWFYHAEETEGTGEGGKRVEDLKHPGALFESCHFDENDIQTISHKCDVIPFAGFLERLRDQPKLKETIYENNDLYYLAGTYDPVVGTLSFKPGVFDA